jgi:hypothetical protein
MLRLLQEATERSKLGKTKTNKQTKTNKKTNIKKNKTKTVV